jgi:hypothetical protein
MSLQSCRRRYVEPTVQFIIHLLGAGAAFPSTTSLKLVSNSNIIPNRDIDADSRSLEANGL